ncbi:hypothetical protein DACRYDRAFT_114887 [Dacryopinax primogenitus]|uniref:Uncharacterized protein n=1 Tax=Dacryopinax primogenitus (strain DJM 731) TaxID=1858805 RepID=M5FZP7_DACPD|nr:uncharacterized protein DACRYDRAFT_114887 [Dacryopinax primogenitus]EJU03496.1 hypothetical protein DACRYDRAFT_114887 [Dacryopinax primogenitus]
MLALQMSQFLSKLDKPTDPPTTPLSTSNHLNVQFHFERMDSTTRHSISLSDYTSPDDSKVSVTVCTDTRKETSNKSDIDPRRRKPQSNHMRRPSTAPASSQMMQHKRTDSSDRSFLELLSGPSTPGSRVNGQSGATFRNTRSATTPSEDWRVEGEPTSSRSTTQKASLPSLVVNKYPPRPHSGAPHLSASSRNMITFDRIVDSSARAAITRSVVSPSMANLNTIPGSNRASHSRRTSSLSLGGGGIQHIVSMGSSMDFGKFMPQTTTSPRSASFNTVGRVASPVDVKRLLTKPATPVGNYSGGNVGRTEDVSTLLSSPTTPLFGSEAPSSPRSSEIRVHQVLQSESTPQSLRTHVSPWTSATAYEEVTKAQPVPEIGQHTTTNARIIRPTTRGREHAGLHTYSSGGEGIGESPQPKQLKRSSSTRPGDRNGNGKRSSTFIKTDGYLSESCVRLPKVQTALTPAAAVALAYRSQSRTGHREERAVVDPKVAPWESQPDLPVQLPTPAPSEWGDLCTPSGFRRLGRKLSLKRSGDEQPHVPTREEARQRARSFDQPRPRDLPGKTSLDAKRPNITKSVAPPTKTTQVVSAPQLSTPEPRTKPPARPPTPAELPASEEHKRRPSFGQQIGGFVRKLSNPNLRTTRKEKEISSMPPVPPLPTLLKEKAELETPVRGKTVRVPPVPAIPIRLTRGSPVSDRDHEEDKKADESALQSAGNSVESLVAFPQESPFTPKSTPLRTSQEKEADRHQKDLARRKRNNSPPHQLDIQISPVTVPETPVRHPGRSRRRPSVKEVLDPAVSKNQEQTTQPAPARRKGDPPPPEPILGPVLSEEEEQAQARRRRASKARREKVHNLSISVSDPRSFGVQAVSHQRSPSLGSTTPRPTGMTSPGLTGRTCSEGDATPFGERKSLYTVAGVFPPPRSASINTPSPSTTTPAKPSPSPMSPPSSTPSMALKSMKIPGGKVPLSEHQKAELWEELLRRCEEAGGTLLLKGAE